MTLRKLPNTFVLIFALLVLIAVATWFGWQLEID